MKLTNTLKIANKIGSNVVEDSRNNLRRQKKETRSNTLYNGINYTVRNNKNNIDILWGFGGAQDYWDFVNEGVKGSGGYSPGDKRTQKQKDQGLRKTGSGLMRAANSNFSFKGKNIAKGVVLGWIKNKPLKLRNQKTGRFMEKNQANLKTAAFLIGRAIAQRGLTRTLFFDNAYNKVIDKGEDKILEAFSEDLLVELEILFN
tara:strand:- start:493 stop:1098 length:606 start_codon:yes stop_codon:yes gene_type:complete